jgi:hypothetical protein
MINDEILDIKNAILEAAGAAGYFGKPVYSDSENLSSALQNKKTKAG